MQLRFLTNLPSSQWSDCHVWHHNVDHRKFFAFQSLCQKLHNQPPNHCRSWDDVNLLVGIKIPSHQRPMIPIIPSIKMLQTSFCFHYIPVLWQTQFVITLTVEHLLEVLSQLLINFSFKYSLSRCSITLIGSDHPWHHRSVGGGGDVRSLRFLHEYLCQQLSTLKQANAA